MGCYIFDQIKYKDYHTGFATVNEFYNFDNFYNAFLMVFRCTSGESWPLIMLEFSVVDQQLIGAETAYLYFIGMIFFCSTIMLNLFVLVVLQLYDEFHQKEENPIERFTEMLEDFKKCWNFNSTEEDKGERISMLKITKFLMDLTGDLAIDFGDDIKKNVPQEKIIKEKVKRAIMDIKFMT